MKVARKQILWFSIIGFCVLVIMYFAGSPDRKVDQSDWIPYTSSAYQDYIFSASHPPDWGVGERPSWAVSRSSGYNGFTIENFPSPIVGVTTTAHLSVYWQKQDTIFYAPFPSAVRAADVPADIMAMLEAGTISGQQLSDIIPKVGCGSRDGTCVEFGRTPVLVSGHQGILIEWALDELYDPDKGRMVAPEAPQGFTIFFAPDHNMMGLKIDLRIRNITTAEQWRVMQQQAERDGLSDWIGLHFGDNTQLAQMYDQLRPAMMAFLDTFQFRRLSEIDDKSDVFLRYKDKIRTSQRQNFWANVHLTLEHPFDWKITEIERRPANRANQVGELILSVTAPDDAQSVGEPEQLFVFLSGIPRHEDGKFLATTDPLVRMILPTFEKTASEAVDIKAFAEIATTTTKFINGTGKTYVTTYVGKDGTGADLKIRTYTAGGQTSVVNFIYIADAADFDRKLPTIEKIIDGSFMYIQNPIIQ